MHLIGQTDPGSTVPDAMPEPSPIRYLPTWDRVLVRRRETNLTSRMGLLLPENFQGKLMEGEVIAVGPGRLSEQGVRLQSGFQVGEIVLFSDQAALRVDPEAPDQLMVAAVSILAVQASSKVDRYQDFKTCNVPGHPSENCGHRGRDGRLKL